MQAIKLYIRNKQAENTINDILGAHEEMILLEKEYNKPLEDIENSKETTIGTWNEYV